MSECIKEDLDKKVEWFENKIVEFLNSYAEITKICAYLKQLWNKDIIKARSKWARDKKKFRKEPKQK